MKKVLFILHLPPPVHGASLVGAQIRDSRRIADCFDTKFMNLSASQGLQEIGLFSFRKVSFVLHLLKEVRDTVRTWKPDLVYVTPTSRRPGFLKDYVLVRMLQREGCRIIAHMHNTGVRECQDRWLDHYLYSRFFPGIQVIQLSERLYPDIRKYVRSEDVFVCPNGVSEMELPEVQDSPVPSLLFFSNLYKAKGIFDFVQMCQVLRDQGFSFRADIAGAETEDLSKHALESLLENSGLSGIVTFHGAVYGSDKARLFSQADLFVFPSHEDAFPLTVVEAMSASLPVVATDVGSLRDMLTDGENGYLVVPGDVLSLADRVGRLLTAPELRRSMGEKSSAHYRKNFSLEQFEKRITEILLQA